MRCDRDADQGVSVGTAMSRQALAFQPDLPAVGQSCRDLDVDILAGRQPHAFHGAFDGLFERDRQCGRDILATVDRVEILGLGRAPPPRARSGAAEHIAENIFEPAESSTAARRAAESLGSPREGLEIAFASESTWSAAGSRRLETVA